MERFVRFVGIGSWQALEKSLFSGHSVRVKKLLENIHNIHTHTHAGGQFLREEFYKNRKARFMISKILKIFT